MKRAFLAVVLSTCAFGLRSSPAQAEGTGEFGGHDAFALTSNQQVLTDCKINWEDAASKKTYCFSSEQNKTEFAKDSAGNLMKAEANFKLLSAQKTAQAVSDKVSSKTANVVEGAKEKAQEAKHHAEKKAEAATTVLTEKTEKASQVVEKKVEAVTVPSTEKK